MPSARLTGHPGPFPPVRTMEPWEDEPNEWLERVGVCRVCGGAAYFNNYGDGFYCVPCVKAQDAAIARMIARSDI